MIKILITSLFICLSTWSADLHLYNEDGSYNNNFSNSIFTQDTSQLLKEDEKIHIRDRSFTFKSLLGKGNTTLILKVQDDSTGKDLALRLPHGNSDFNWDISDGKRYINYTIAGYDKLKSSKLPIPQIHAYEKNSHILVDHIAHDFTLKYFLALNEKFEPQLKDRALNALYDFAKASAHFSSIEDFHLEQLVYSKESNQWILLDWASKSKLAQTPSSIHIFKKQHFIENSLRIYSSTQSPELRDITRFEKQVYNSLNETIETQRRLQVQLDQETFDSLKLKLDQLTNYNEILDEYRKIGPIHMASFYSMVQKDFIDVQIEKFPSGIMTKELFENILNQLGEFSSFYFSEFAQKMIGRISDIETLMELYKRVNYIGVDEELEDDIATAIAANMKRILSNSTSSPENLKIIEELRSDYGIINYRSREILAQAQDHLKLEQSCNDLVSSIMQRSAN